MTSKLNEILGRQAEQPRVSHEHLKTLISLASLLVAALIGMASKDLPWWGLVGLIFVLLILLGFIVWSPLCWIYRKVRARRANNRAALIYFPDLNQFLRRFSREVSDSYTNNLTYELRSLQSIRDKRGNGVVENLHEFGRILDWVLLFSRKTEMGKTSDLEECLRAMNLAVTQYWWVSYSIQNRFTGILASSQIDDSDRQKLITAWNNGRENANRFFVDWTTLSEKIGNSLAQPVGPIEHSLLKSLS